STRRVAVEEGTDQLYSENKAGRSDRAVGNQSYERRDPRNQTSKRRSGRHGQANDRREEQTGTGHRIRRHSGVLSSQSRRSEERSYPASRRTKAVCDPSSRG